MSGRRGIVNDPSAKPARGIKGMFTDDDLQSVQASIMDRPPAAPTIAGTGGMRKLRVPLPGRGKRGGARVIYFNRNERGDLVLLLVYVKAKFDNIPAATLMKLKEALDA